MEMKTAKNIGIVMVLSTAARGMSLLAGMLYTTYFGLGNLELNIYSYAVNLPNLVFTCIGTALFTVVIPIYTGGLAEGETLKASKFADNVISVSLVFSVVMSIAGVLATPGIVSITESFSVGNWDFANMAIRLMFPLVIFHSLNHIYQALLQSNSRFVMPAVVSMVNGVAIIIYMLFFADAYGVTGLLVVTFAGFSVQPLMLLPSAHLAGYRYKPQFDFKNEDLRKAGKLALPVLVSSSSYQLNMFVNVTLATGFIGGAAAITTTQNLAFTAAHLFILSTLAVMFPKMSAQSSIGDIEGFKGSFTMILKLIIYFAIPASMGLAAVSGHIMSLLYGYGKMTDEGVMLMTTTFAIYALAIASIGIKEASDRAFYAMKDSKTPAIISVFIMVMNVALSLVLRKPLGIAGLPVAYAVSITSGALALLYLVRKKTGLLTIKRQDEESVKSMLVKCVASGIIMVLTILVINRVFFPDMVGVGFVGDAGAGGAGSVGDVGGAGAAGNTDTTLSNPIPLSTPIPFPIRALRLVISVLVGSVVYFLMTLALKVEQTRKILRVRRSKVG